MGAPAAATNATAFPPAESAPSKGNSDAYNALSTLTAGPLTLSILVQRPADSDNIRITITRTSPPVQGVGEPLFLHWGVVPNTSDDRSIYVRPDSRLWPNATDPRDGQPSVQSPFLDVQSRSPTLQATSSSSSSSSSSGGNGLASAANAPLVQLDFCFPESLAPAGIVFLVFVKGERTFRGQWLKGPGGSSFYIDVDPAISSKERTRRVQEHELMRQQETERIAAEDARKKAEAAERQKLIALEAEQRESREKDARDFLSSALAKSSPPMQLFAECDVAYDFGSIYFRAFIPSKLEHAAANYGTRATGKDHSNVDHSSESDPVPATLLVASTLAFGNNSEIILHWGVKSSGRGSSGWSVVSSDHWPQNTEKVGDGKALQTKMLPHGTHGTRVLTIKDLPRGVIGLFAVVHIPGNPGHMQWVKAHGNKDIFVPLTAKPPLKGLPSDYGITTVATTVVENIIEREMEYGSWTLMHRYSYGRQLVDSEIGRDHFAWSAIYVWMRYSQIRVLDWQRNYNTKPRELSHAQLSFVTCLANRLCTMPEIRWLARLAMSCVGRGGSGDLGQRIRDDILVILRHNRGWGHGSMMEQWHQKLHNATDPTDVVICDALLAFWRSNGDISQYWKVLSANDVTRQRLASYEQPVTVDPDFVGHIKDTMIHELTRYGELLKTVHLGTDLTSIVDICQPLLEGNTRRKVNDYTYARNTAASLVDVLRAVADAREALASRIVCNSDDHSRRDLIFLDLALEADTRRFVESMIGVGHNGNLWSHLISVRAAAQSLKCSEVGLKTEGELDRAIHEVQAVIDRLERQGESHDVGLRAAAALTIFRNAVTEIVDRYESSLGPLGRCMGMAFGAEKDVIATFIEEAVRGGPAYVLSALLRKAEPAIRRVADLGPYSVIAPHPKESTGPLVVFHKLRESIGAKFKRGTVVVADICDGDEDVPKNVEFVVIGSNVDVLSHVSVRARNEKHGLIACLDRDELARLRSMHGCIVKAKLVGENFDIEIIDESGRLSPSVGFLPVLKRVRSSGIITPPSGMQTPPSEFLSLTRSPSGFSSGILSPGGQALVRKSSARSLRALGLLREAVSERQLAAPWAIRPSEFNTELVGSKSLNLQRLVALGMGDWIKTPISLAIPNGAMRKVLASEKNLELAEEYKRMVEDISKAKPGDVKLCAQLREIIMCLDAPEGLNEALRGVLDDLGCEDIDAALPGAWEAVKGVWASLWNERAHLARQKLRLDIHDVDMAVLCQKIIDAEYAFVIHTSNPLTNDKNEIYAECVVGLGETLVGNAPGQALGFTVRKDEDIETTVPIVRSYPSKAIALVGGEYIFRSDSNAEDLEGFAGAGLHDSIPIVKNRVVDIDYSQERLMTDDEFRLELMRAIAKIGIEVEDVMGGSPQDIEGCYKNGEFYVVQARPQV